MLDIQNLTVEVDDKIVLQNLDLMIKKGEVYALFGPNGSGKTTLLNTLVGLGQYKVKSGSIIFDGEKINDLPINKRAKKGLALSFQLPPEIRGVTLKNMVNICLKNKHDAEIDNESMKLIERLNLTEYLERDINVGFSGGEKKRADILQMLLMKPKMLLLDEPDSGVDIESLKIIADEISKYIKNNDATALIITHQGHMIDFMDIKKGCILYNGTIRCLKDPKYILDEISSKGYARCVECQKRI